MWRVSIAFSTMLLVACQSGPPRNHGVSGGRLDPTHDARSELGSLELRSPDLVTATDRMAQSIAGRLDVVNRDNPPSIVVGEIENYTSRPERDYQVFLDRLRAQLMSSGARYGLHFVRERTFIEQQRAREFGPNQPEHAPRAYRSPAEYVLTCQISDLPSGGTNYYLIDYELVQLVDRATTGPDLGAAAIVWESAYEVKYQ